MNAIEQIESAVASIEIELAYIKAAIDKLNAYSLIGMGEEQ